MSSTFRTSLLAVSGLLMLPVMSGNALACMEYVSIDSRIRGAEIIFKGQLVRYEIQKTTRHGGSEKEAVVRVFKIDKNLRNAIEGQEIQVSDFGPLYGHASLSHVPKELHDAIVIIPAINGEAETAGVHYIPVCPEAIFNSPQDIKQIEQKLMHKWKYQPFWMYRSFKRWVMGN